MGSLEQHLLNVNVVLIAAGAWFILWVLRKIWKGMDTVKLIKRFKPLYPAILCEAFVWIPGALPADPEPTVGSRILMGLWCGFLASIGYQLIKRFMGERGVKLPDNPEDLLPTSEDDKPVSEESAAEEPSSRESAITPIATPVPRGSTEEESGADDKSEVGS